MVFSWGPCPKMEVVEPFDINRYMGRWYEATKFPNRFETGLRCISAMYTLEKDGKVRVENSGLKDDNGKKVAIGQAVQAVPGTGKLKVAFSKYAPYGNYWVLKTDYDKYSCVYSCSNFGIFHWTFFWILVRDRKHATEAHLKPITDFAKSVGVEVEHLEPANNDNCPE